MFLKIFLTYRTTNLHFLIFNIYKKNKENTQKAQYRLIEKEAFKKYNNILNNLSS